jgi:hypothetical protein
MMPRPSIRVKNLTEREREKLHDDEAAARLYAFNHFPLVQLWIVETLDWRYRIQRPTDLVWSFEGVVYRGEGRKA